MSNSRPRTTGKKLVAGLPKGISVARTLSGRGKQFFRVRLGKRFTGGQVVQKDFSVLAEARDWIFGGAEGADAHKANTGSIVDLKQEAGKAAFVLNASQLSEAANAIRRCEEAEITLTEAVDFAIRNAKPPSGSISFAKASELALQKKLKSKKAPSYISDLKKRWGRFEKWLPSSKRAAINSIGRFDVRKVLDDCGLEPVGERNMLRNLSVLFSWAVDRHYAASNPCKGIRLERQSSKPPVRILSITEADRIFKLATEGFEVEAVPDDPHLSKLSRVEPFELIPFLALGAFAGFRPEESLGIKWEMIDLRKGQIDLPAHLAKDRNRRIVDISVNLLAWLESCPVKSGSIVPLNIRRKRMALRNKMGWEKWPVDILRHSYGSYHLALHQNAPLTAETMGHREVRILYRHYREVIKDPEDIRNYWNIKPDQTLPSRRKSSKKPLTKHRSAG
jgi:integrase